MAENASRAAEIRERQQAITELTESLDFREAIAVVGSEAASIRSDWLVAWAEGPPVLSPRWLRYLAWAITAAFTVTLVLWLTTDNSTPMSVVLGVQIAFAWPQQKRVERVSHGADTAARDLDVARRAAAAPGARVVLVTASRRAASPPRH